MSVDVSVPSVAAPTREVAVGHRLSPGTIALTGGLFVLAMLWLIPLAWIVLTALKPEPEIIRLPIRWLPEQPTLGNFAAPLTTSRTANIGVAFGNSMIVAIAETALTLVIDSMAAYALA